jgi:hypothetical protein
MDYSRGAMPHALSALLFSATIAVGCAGESPSGPSGGGVDLTGRWSGTATDSSGPGSMIWQITANGATITGTITMSDAESGIAGEGTLRGDLSGAGLDFTIDIPVGGFGDPYDECAAQVSGRAQAAPSSLSGTYTGVNSCTGAIGSGQLTLSRQ